MKTILLFPQPIKISQQLPHASKHTLSISLLTYERTQNFNQQNNSNKKNFKNYFFFNQMSSGSLDGNGCFMSFAKHTHTHTHKTPSPITLTHEKLL